VNLTHTLRAAVVAVLCLCAALVLAGAGNADDGDFFLDNTQVSVYPGDLTGPYQERYLSEDNGSHAAIETPYGGTPKPYLTKRWADGTSSFAYTIPVSPTTPAPLYLTMVTKGEVRLTVDGNLLLNTGNSGEGDYTPREFKLTDSALWADGAITVRFQDADTSDGWGPNLYSLELGPTSRWTNRIQHIDWDTPTVVWNVGYPEGTANEFIGATTDFTIGGDPTTLRRDGTVRIHWSQTVDPSQRYHLLVGAAHSGSGNVTIDVGADGSAEISRPTGGEKVFDLDITNRVLTSGNVVSVSVPTGTVFDFFAVVAGPLASTLDPDTLRVSFSGNEQADHFTRLINQSMFFTLDMLNRVNTGYIDASAINGAYYNSFYVADFAPAVQELLHFGYLDRVREALDYARADADGHYDQDVAAGNLLFDAMCSLLRADNLSASDQTAYWNRLVAGMTRLEQYINATPYHLVYGTNPETSSYSYGIYASATSYYALRNAADIAGAIGQTAKRNEWNGYADTLYNGINTNLRWPADTTWLGQPMRRGTWRYGLLADGSNPSGVAAAWQSIGSAKDAYKGLAVDDNQFRDVSNATLDYHSATFWPNWKATGNNKGFGTDYGVLSERGGWPLNSLLEADRIGDATKNVNHIVFNSSDQNFAPTGPNDANAPDNNGDVDEWSPWAIIRETDPNDRGSSSVVGNGAGGEDLNLVEYILFLKNARIIAGVDDALNGSNNLILIPRLPLGWRRVHVKGWPITYRPAAGGYARTTVSYAVTVDHGQSTADVSAGAPIAGVQVRLGPFDPTARVTGVTIDGTPTTTFSEQVRGDSAWVWTTTDIGTTSKHLVATVVNPQQLQDDNFDDGVLDGWTPNGGTWTPSNGQATASAPGDAWNIFTSGPTVTGGGIAADVRLDSGHAVGVSLRTNTTGSQGYDLILDRVDGLLKLARRPYTVLTSIPVHVSLQRTYHLELRASGSLLTGYLDGVAALSATDTTYGSGRTGLFAYSSTTAYENVRIEKGALLEEVFDGTDLDGWTPNGGTWSNDVTHALVTTSGNAWNINAVTAGDVTYTANVRLMSGNAVGISVRTNSNGTQGYDLILDRVDGGIKLARRPYVVLAQTPTTIDFDHTYNLRIEAVGSTLRCYLDGNLKFTVTDGTYPSGHVGLFAYNSTAQADDARAVG
jgi:hypothetical protein